MEEKIAFGVFIAQKRKENNLTQKELAEKLYMTESAISKWERGVSYPDISVISGICEALNISERELITASEDLQQHKIEKHAKSYEKLVKVYLSIFNILYGVTLLVCFIVNLAVNHKLSWFIIVFLSICMAYSLTVLPVIVEKHKGLFALISFFISLNLLLLYCNAISSGGWFGITFIALLFSFTLVFMPLIIRKLELPDRLYRHKALICLVADTILLIILVAAGCINSGTWASFWKTGLPITLFCVILPWIYLLFIRYTRINRLFKTSLCFGITSIYILVINSVLNVIIEHVPFALQKVNFQVWTNEYANGNCTMIIFLVCIFIAVLFAIGGVFLEIRKNKK